MKSIRPITNIALVPLFFGFIWLPTLLWIIGYDPMPRPNENHPPKPMPALPKSVSALRVYPSSVEASFNDHFGGRNTLVYASLWTKAVALGVSPYDMTVVGKEGWTYLGLERQLTATRGIALLTEDNLKKIRWKLEQQRDFCAENGAAFLAFYPPDKSTIYPEYLPNWMHPESTVSNLDLVLEHMAKHSTVALLDLRPALREGKQGGLVYLPCNSHWNNFGAFVGYQAIATEIQTLLPGFHPLEHNEMDFRTRPREFNDWGSEIDIAYFRTPFLEDAHIVRRRAKPIVDVRLDPALQKKASIHVLENEDQSLPKLVCFHDSFGWSLTPLLAEGFSRAVFVRSLGFSEEIIALEKPDLVISLRVECMLTPVAVSK